MLSGLNLGLRFNGGLLGSINADSSQFSQQYCQLNNEQNAYILDDYHRLLGPLIDICPQLQTLGPSNSQLEERMQWNRSIEETFFLKFKSENTANELKRQMKIHELLQLELNLCMDIAVLITVYQRPMLQMRLITSAESQKIFANLETLFIVHQKLAIGLARIRNRDGVYQSGPGLVILEWAHQYLHHYLSYCPNLPEAQSCIAQKQTPLKNSQFAVYLCSESVIRFSRRFDLWTMIDRPRRHLMNYPLVLRSIAKLTNDQDDVNNLQDTIDSVKKMITQIQQKMDQQNFESLVVRLDLKRDKSNKMSSVDTKDSNPEKKRHLIVSHLNASSHLIMESRLHARKVPSSMSNSKSTNCTTAVSTTTTTNSFRRPRIRFNHFHSHHYSKRQKLSLILFDRLLVLAKPCKNNRFIILASVGPNHQLHYCWHREVKTKAVKKAKRRLSSTSYRRTRWRNLVNLMVYFGRRIRKQKQFLPAITAALTTTTRTRTRTRTRAATKSKRNSSNNNCLCLRAPNTKFNIDCQLQNSDEVNLWVNKLKTVFTMVDEGSPMAQ